MVKMTLLGLLKLKCKVYVICSRMRRERVLVYERESRGYRVSLLGVAFRVAGGNAGMRSVAGHRFTWHGEQKAAGFRSNVRLRPWDVTDAAPVQLWVLHRVE